MNRLHLLAVTLPLVLSGCGQYFAAAGGVDLDRTCPYPKLTEAGWTEYEAKVSKTLNRPVTFPMLRMSCGYANPGEVDPRDGERTATRSRAESAWSRLKPAIAASCQSADGCDYELKVGGTTEVLALASEGSVYISYNFVRFCQSEDELAFILAHEASHNLLHKDKFARKASLSRAEIWSMEQEADQSGVRLMVAAGFDPRTLADFFRRYEELRRPSDRGEHPPSAQRLAALTPQLNQFRVAK